MSTGLSKSNIGMAALGLALLLLSIMAYADLTGVTLNTPPDSGNVSGNYLLNATNTGWATSTSFYWSNDSGTTWYLIQSVTNTTPQQSGFTYLWDSSGIGDGTGLDFNATATNGTTVVSDTSTGITLDNTAPVVTINGPQNYSIIQTSVATLNVTLTETNPSVSWWEADSNGTNITGCIGCTDFENTTSMGDGEHNITVWSNDTLGNEDSATVFFLTGTTPVTVNVKDAGSGQNLENSNVTFSNSYSALNTTDSGGNTILGVYTGLLYNISVASTGYSTNTSLTNQNFTVLTTRNVLLSGGSTLQGYVKEMGSGNPIVATVSVHDNSTGTLTYQVQSSSSGYYSVSVPDSFSYYVNITSSGYATFINGNYTGSAEVNASLYQAGYGSFTFIVTDRWNGRPVPGANVTVEWSVNESGLTNSSGMVLIEVPEGGSFDIHASANGYMDNSSLTGLSVTEGSNTNVYVKMQGNSKIYGYVKDSANSQGMSGAFLELWDEDNSYMLNWSSSYFYNATSAGVGYYEFYYPSTLSGLSLYVHCSLTGYTSREVYSGGTQRTDINLVGTATVRGKVVDNGNTSVGISGATVKLLNATSGSVLYQKSTDGTGNFSVSIRNGTNHTLRVEKTGYTTYVDVTPYNTSHDYGNVELEGTAMVTGKVVDYQNQTINLQGVSVKFSYGNLTYTTTTNSAGNFAINVSPGYTYSIAYEKTGYTTKTTSSSVSGYKNLGTITLYGSNLVNGTVTDPTRYVYEELEDVQVKLAGGGRVYQVTTNYNGYYSLYVPSDILSYTITFTKDGFKQKTVSQAGDVILTGATRVDGRVYDVYNDESLSGAEVCFLETLYYYLYCTETNATGFYSMDIGVGSNFFIYAHKSGYDYEIVGFTDLLGFPYDTGDTGAWDRTEDMGLSGENSVYVKTFDGFSGDPVENSQVCLRKEGEQDCFYSRVTDYNGETRFYAKDGETYSLIINSLGYPSENLGLYTGSISETVELGAYAKSHVYDQYATDEMKDIPNSNITLYYFNNQTLFNYTLNGTNVTINTACGFVQRDGINVTLNGETQTTSGSGSLTFTHVPVGLHIIEINGTMAGCGLDTKTITIDEGGTSYTFPDYTAYNLNPTNLFVLVQNRAGTGLAGATVTVNSTTGGQNYTASDLGSGFYNVSYVLGDNYTVYAGLANYTTNSTNYTVSIGYENNFTNMPLLLISYPGNLSIYVQNSTDGLDGINVTLDNGTEFTTSTTGGWANFTDMVGLYDVKVNGTGTGYEYNLTEDYFVQPNQESQMTYILEKTLVTIIVMNQTSLVNQSNVTLYNGSQIAQSATGIPLTALTNSSGMVSFQRVMAWNYTLNITKTNYTGISTPAELYFESSPNWNHTYFLNKTILEVTVRNMEGNALNNTYVTLVNSTYVYSGSGYTDENGNITFDLGGSSGGIYNLTADGGSLGYGLASSLVTITEKTLNKKTAFLDINYLNLTVNDTNTSSVEDWVILSLGSLTNTTSSGQALLYGVATGSQTLVANGTLQGYGINTSYPVINHGENNLTSILPITGLTVHVANSSGQSVSGADVRMLNGTTYELEGNGKGTEMNGTTDSSGNVTFSFVPVGTYKIITSKNSLDNYTFYQLNVSNAGAENVATLYLSYSSTETLDAGNPADTALTFTVTNTTDSAIENVTVRVQNRTDNSTVAGGLTNSSGQVVLYVPHDTIYNFQIDGELVGYGKTANYSVPIGYAGVSEGYTDVSGWSSLNIHGRTNYMLKIENAYGYYDYDDNDTGTIRNGTYDDALSSNPYARSSIQVPMTGKTNLTGTIYDANFVNPVDLNYEPVYSAVYLYASSGCSGQVRYSINTENNGSYSIYLSPKQLGSNTDMSYCIKTVGTGWDDGYKYSMVFREGSEEENRSMQGSGSVSGYVREAVTSRNLPNVNVSLRSKGCYGGYANCEAYRHVTGSGGTFSFNISSHTSYYPYDILLNKTNYFGQESNDTIYTDNTSLVYYMIPLGRAIMNINVTGSNLTENVTIKWGNEIYSGLNEYCSMSQNVLSCLLPSGGRVLTINGSDIGYGVYSQYTYLVQGQNYTQNIRLNETTVNVTISNQDSSPLDNITVTLNGFENTTENGHVFFRKVPGGIRNITFSGYLSTIYGIGSQTVQINVTPGQNNTYQYTFNETQFLVTVQNESSLGIQSLTVYLSNANTTFQNTTDSNGQSLFRQVPYGNYTVSFNATQILSMGYQDRNETADVQLGGDALSGNNLTVTLEDTEVSFNITNSTDPLQNINVSMLQSGSIAQNGYGSGLTNLTDSAGFVTFHNVIAGTYTYLVNGTSQGYETVLQSLTVTTTGSNVSVTLSIGSGTTSTTTTTTTTTTTLAGSTGGGGGGGGPATKINATGDLLDISSLTISSGSIKTLEIGDWEGMIYKIAIYASQYIYRAAIKMERLDSWEIWEIPSLTGSEVYHYFKIDTEGVEGKTKSVTLYFSVENDWIAENSITDVSLWKYDSGWKKLETEKVGTEAGRTNYMSTFSGFSYFAVAGEVGEATESNVTPSEPGRPEEGTVCGNGICEPGEDCPSDCMKAIPEFKLDINFILAMVIAVTAILALALFFVEKKKERKTAEVKLPPPPKPFTKIKEIIDGPDRYIGKKVMIEGEITGSEFLADENRVQYRIKDPTGEISGLSRHAGFRGQGTIEGTVRRKKRNVYIEF